MSIARRLAKWTAVLTLLLLAACSGDNHPAPPPLSFSIAKSSVTFTAAVTDGTPVSQAVNGSILNVTSTVYLRVVVTGQAVMNATANVTGPTSGQILIYPFSPGELGVGTYTSTIAFISRKIIGRGADQTCIYQG